LRCPRCQFENMPGQAACFRCGSLLEAKAGAVEVHPPRAPAWKKPFRRVARWTRRLGAARSIENLAARAAGRTAAFVHGRAETLTPQLPARWPSWGDLCDAAIVLALSIVPGLAHLVRGRFGGIWLYVVSWFISLAMGIYYLGSGLGSASIASAFVLHGWIAMDAVFITNPFRDELTAREKMGCRFCGVGVLVILLYAASGTIERVAGFTVGGASVTVPAHQVEWGDNILCRYLRVHPGPPPLHLGDLVLVHAHDARPGYSGHYLGDMVGQLIALPGDEVALTEAGFTVNGRALLTEKFPIPASLHGQSGPMTLGKDEYFVTMEWRGQVHGGVVGINAKFSDCVYDRRDVLARGVMRWLPMRKRGFLEALE
jgi:hypothetical protein